MYCMYHRVIVHCTSRRNGRIRPAAEEIPSYCAWSLDLDLEGFASPNKRTCATATTTSLCLRNEKHNNNRIMGFLSLFIVNKSGGLIHHRPLGPNAPQIGTNEWLRIGSTFHSLHAIAAEASPLRLPGNKNPCKLESPMAMDLRRQCIDRSHFSMQFLDLCNPT